ncbi:MAG: PspA/IM30 family protein [Proteobacteria bacterium]|nr:PspA/IM30 family protein [Pseudomonadota bacterium]
MRIFAPISMVAAFVMMAVPPAHAQWGYGMYGAMQSCPWGVSAGDGASDIQDEIQDMQSALVEKRQKLSEEKRKQREMQRKYDQAKERVNKNLNVGYSNLIIDHIDGKRKCSDYQTRVPAPTDAVQNRDLTSSDSGAVSDPSGGSATAAEDTGVATDPYAANVWGAQICDRSRDQAPKGGGRVVVRAACTVPAEAKVSQGYNQKQCETAVAYLQDNKDKLDQQAQLVAALEADIENSKTAIADKRGELRDAVREAQREAREQMTEGGCIDCMMMGNGYVMQPRKPGTGEILANVGLGIASMYFGNKQQQYITDMNSKLGFPTQSYPSIGFGFPYFMGALYGAIGGGVGGGAFGCMGGMGGTGGFNGPYGMMGPFGMGGMYGGNGGAFGYPHGMYGMPMGGGMFMPGMGPWGMAGPWGNGPWGAYPGGMMASGGIGFMMPGGYMMGMPMGAMQMGMPMGNMMGMMAGGGMGMPMGNMMGMMAGGGMGMMAGGGMGSDMMGMQMQMQQQMMQMQMQQYQMQMQMAMRAQENYMARQRVVMGLQQELYSLLYRLQQAQMGVSTGGYFGFEGGFGGGYTPGMPGGSPLPGTGLPGGGQFPGSQVPNPGGGPSGVPSVR